MEKTQNLSKQSEESDTRSKPSVSGEHSRKGDGFFIARLRLTFYYTLFTAIIVGGFSIILYQTLLSNFADTLRDAAPSLNPQVFGAVVEKAHVILANRLLVADGIILSFAAVLGFLLTDRTLKPIRENMHRQKRFIADASHELRTPIAVIISGLEVALRNKNLTIDQGKETISSTLDEMREFSKMTNQLLDLSKYDISKGGSGEGNRYELVNIAEILATTSAKMKTLADEKEIKYEMKIKSDQNIKVRGSEVDLSRVFYNIIHNAITYTPKNGSITVEGHISMGKYVVTVTDTGIGIAPKTLEKIFEPFFQGDSSRKNSGAGLGLTLARKIVDSHRGTIVIKSKENHGTKAVISVPLSS